MTTYLISNVHRCGSSMMMRCLIAAGLEGVYDKEFNIALDLTSNDPNYHPNPNGFYQLNTPPNEYTVSLYEGKVLKFPFRRLIHLPQGDYKICFLKRNPLEIEKSMQNFTPYRSWGRDSVLLEFYDQIIDTILDNLNQRTDINLTVLNYADIVANPTIEFTKLYDNGWPININAAASLVDDSLYRFKLENI